MLAPTSYTAMSVYLLSVFKITIMLQAEGGELGRHHIFAQLFNILAEKVATICVPTYLASVLVNFSQSANLLSAQMLHETKPCTFKMKSTS